LPEPTWATEQPDFAISTTSTNDMRYTNCVTTTTVLSGVTTAVNMALLQFNCLLLNFGTGS